MFGKHPKFDQGRTETVQAKPGQGEQSPDEWWPARRLTRPGTRAKTADVAKILLPMPPPRVAPIAPSHPSQRRSGFDSWAQLRKSARSPRAFPDPRISQSDCGAKSV